LTRSLKAVKKVVCHRNEKDRSFSQDKRRFINVEKRRLFFVFFFVFFFFVFIFVFFFSLILNRFVCGR